MDNDHGVGEGPPSLDPQASPGMQLVEAKQTLNPGTHENACTLEVEVLEKHAKSCTQKQLLSKKRRSKDETQGSFIVIERFAYDICQNVTKDKKPMLLTKPVIAQIPAHHLHYQPSNPQLLPWVKPSQKSEELGIVDIDGSLAKLPLLLRHPTIRTSRKGTRLNDPATIDEPLPKVRSKIERKSLLPKIGCQLNDGYESVPANKLSKTSDVKARVSSKKNLRSKDVTNRQFPLWRSSKASKTGNIQNIAKHERTKTSSTTNSKTYVIVDPGANFCNKFWPTSKQPPLQIYQSISKTQQYPVEIIHESKTDLKSTNLYQNENLDKPSPETTQDKSSLTTLGTIYGTGTDMINKANKETFSTFKPSIAVPPIFSSNGRCTDLGNEDVTWKKTGVHKIREKLSKIRARKYSVEHMYPATGVEPAFSDATGRKNISNTGEHSSTKEVEVIVDPRDFHGPHKVSKKQYTEDLHQSRPRDLFSNSAFDRSGIYRKTARLEAKPEPWFDSKDICTMTSFVDGTYKPLALLRKDNDGNSTKPFLTFRKDKYIHNEALNEYVVSGVSTDDSTSLPIPMTTQSSSSISELKQEIKSKPSVVLEKLSCKSDKNENEVGFRNVADETNSVPISVFPTCENEINAKVDRELIIIEAKTSDEEMSAPIMAEDDKLDDKEYDASGQNNSKGASVDLGDCFNKGIAVDLEVLLYQDNLAGDEPTSVVESVRYEPDFKPSSGGEVIENERDFKPASGVEVIEKERDFKSASGVKVIEDDRDFKSSSGVEVFNDERDFKSSSGVEVIEKERDFKSFSEVEVIEKERDFKPASGVEVIEDERDFKPSSGEEVNVAEPDFKPSSGEEVIEKERDFKPSSGVAGIGNNPALKPPSKLQIALLQEYESLSDSSVKILIEKPQNEGEFSSSDDDGEEDEEVEISEGQGDILAAATAAKSEECFFDERLSSSKEAAANRKKKRWYRRMLIWCGYKHLINTKK